MAMEISSSTLINKSLKMPTPVKGIEIETSIKVNKHSHNHSKAWLELESELIDLIEYVEPLKLDTPIYSNKVIFYQLYFTT